MSNSIEDFELFPGLEEELAKLNQNPVLHHDPLDIGKEMLVQVSDWMDGFGEDVKFDITIQDGKMRIKLSEES